MGRTYTPQPTSSLSNRMMPPVSAEREDAASVSRIRMPAIPRSTPTRSSRRSGERLSQNEGDGAFCAGFLADWLFAFALWLFLGGGAGLKRGMQAVEPINDWGRTAHGCVPETKVNS